MPAQTATTVMQRRPRAAGWPMPEPWSAGADRRRSPGTTSARAGWRSRTRSSRTSSSATQQPPGSVSRKCSVRLLPAGAVVGRTAVRARCQSAAVRRRRRAGRTPSSLSRSAAGTSSGRIGRIVQSPTRPTVGRADRLAACGFSWRRTSSPAPSARSRRPRRSPPAGPGTLPATSSIWPRCPTAGPDSSTSCTPRWAVTLLAETVRGPHGYAGAGDGARR